MKFFYALFALLVVSTNAATPVVKTVEDSVVDVPNAEAVSRTLVLVEWKMNMTVVMR